MRKIFQLLFALLLLFACSRQSSPNYTQLFTAWGDKTLKHQLLEIKPSPLGDLITGLMKEQTGAELALLNYYAIRGGLSGIITRGLIEKALPFKNRLVVMELKGEALKKLLAENQLKAKDFLLTSGLKTRNNSLLIGGKPLENNRFYQLVTIDYLAKGAQGKRPEFLNARKRKSLNLTLNDLLFNYLKANRLLFPPGEKDNFALSLTEAVNYLNNRQGDKARSALNRLHSLFPAQPAPLIFLGELEFNQKNSKKAAEYFLSAEKLLPEDKELKLLNLEIFGSFRPKAQKGAYLLEKSPAPRFRGSRTAQGLTDCPGPLAPSLLFKFKTGYQIMSSVVIDQEGNLLFGSGDFNLYCLNPLGKLRWKFPASDSILSTPALAADGGIYFGSNDGCLYALNSKGELQWLFPTRGWVVSSPNLSDQGVIYFGSYDGCLYALGKNGELFWKFKTGGEIFSSPAVFKNNLYFGSKDSFFYALNSEGELLFKIKTGEKIFSSPALAPDGTVYFGSDDGFLYAVTPQGKIKWKFKTGGLVPASPAILKSGDLVFASEEGKLYSLNTEGKLLWSTRLGSEIFSSPLLCEQSKMIYLGTEDNKIYGLNFQGRVAWYYGTGGYVNASPVLSYSGVLYIGSNDGYLYAFAYPKNK